jgi:hypothetical protein
MINVDLLDEDKPIAQQKYVCLSFVSPEKIIKKKEEFFFEKFLETYELDKSMSKFVQFVNYISYKYNINAEELLQEYESFIKSENLQLSKDLSDDYKNYIDKNEDELEKTFSKENNFQTSVRGLKVRGVFPTQEEAELRCKMIRQVDQNHDVYVGPVGIWIPFHPDAYKTGKVEYLEKELNDLMHEKNKNEEKAKDEFDKRVKESKIKAIEENIKKAQENDNKLTQTINDKGELVSIENMNTQEKLLGVNATMEDIKRELFEGGEIPTSSDYELKTKETENETETETEAETDTEKELIIEQVE